MKLSARKMGSMKALKESLKKGGGGSGGATYIKNVPADGITVRFLTEPDEWFGYYEYWDDSAKTFVPMAEGEVLPDGARPSFRYLTNALDVTSDRVIPLKLAKTIANTLIVKYDKYDTMMDRNYELQRHGEGLDTTYDVEPEAPSKMNLAKYDILNLEEVLIAARAQAIGEVATSGSSTAVVDDEDIDDEVDEEVEDDEAEDDEESDEATGDWDYGKFDPEKLFPDEQFRDNYSKAELSAMSPDDLDGILDMWEIKKSKNAIADILKAQADYYADAEEGDDDEEVEADEDTDEDAEGEPEADESEEDDEVQEYDEDELNGMSIRDLRLIAIDLGIDHKGKSKPALIAAIIDAAEE